MSSNFKLRLKDLTNRLRGHSRHGPVSYSYRSLVLDLAHARNKILEDKDSLIRDFLLYAMSLGNISRSQIFQDAFVLYVLGEKRDGFFCDFGATNGVSLSNSYVLERHYNWHGICAEPARIWHDDLYANRPNSLIETDCVWSKTGETVTFSETRVRELSTITTFAENDLHARHRRGAQCYEVRTISLNDLLDKHGAPRGFDYLSIDTEGSELDILLAFDIERFKPKVITVEHNYTKARQPIHELLAAAGYRRVLTETSLFDDWYLAPGIELPVSG